MIERHVVSFELAQRLKDAGFPHDCYFAWYHDEGVGPVLGPAVPALAPSWQYMCAAPMLSEIMESVLATGIELVDVWACAGDDWVAAGGVPRTTPSFAATGPDAAALLWLALKEGK